MEQNKGNSRYAFNLTRQSFLASELRVADTHFQRLRGLMGPNSALPNGSGLWIKPCHGVHTMFMRYPIDVVYLDEQHRVLRIEDNVRPWRLTAVLVEAASVLELPAHTAFNSGTQPGDLLEIKVTSNHDGEPCVYSETALQ